MKKVTVVGSGKYGSMTALRVAEYDLVDSVVMTDIVDGFTRAHMFLEKAGQPNLLIGNAVIRGAFGDDPRHWEMISKRVSAT